MLRVYFSIGALVLLLSALCLSVQAQTSPNDIVFVNSDIYTMKADGSGQINLTNTGGTYECPTWSPDGSRIAYGRGSRVWIMNADGSNKTQITNDVANCPSWSPDGSKIAFHRSDGNRTDIYVMNVDGTNQTRW